MTFRKILAFHIGHVGDTIVTLPSVNVLKNTFPNARFDLLCDKTIGNGYVLGHEIFKNTGHFTKIFTFLKFKNRWLHSINPIFLMSIIPVLRKEKYNAVAYLVPSIRTEIQRKRDKMFFQASGIKYFIGFKGFEPHAIKTAKNGVVRNETDAILDRLSKDGFNTPLPGMARIDLELNVKERIFVDMWLNSKGIEMQNRIFVGFGPGSKMDAKKWPIERYDAVGRRLIESFNIYPMIFGGKEDQNDGNYLIRKWGVGINAAGKLSLRQAAEALSRCGLYIGNDTGTMHLAAAVKTPCVAIFSARDLKGKWYPYGENHIVIRKEVKCAGCKLEYCWHKSCLLGIRVGEVISAATSKMPSVFRTP